MQHSFDVEIATQYGILEAVILNNFNYWICKNEANNVNYYDGAYWTYNSVRALETLFPYTSKKRIDNALKHLINEGLIQTGNYNKLAYDRTIWYAFTEKGKCIYRKGEMDLSKKGNGFTPEGKPIPNINTDINTTNIIYIVDYLNKKAGTSYKHTSKNTQKSINARLNEGYTTKDFEKVIDNQCSRWLGTEWEQYLRPTTLFGNKFENYLNSKVTQNDYATRDFSDLDGVF